MLVLEGHAGTVNALAFSPDGQMLASTSKDGTVRLWDPPCERTIWERGYVDDALGLPAISIQCLAFTSNGSQLAIGGQDGTAYVWDIVNGQTTQAPTQRQPVTAIAFLPNDQTLAIACGDPISDAHLPRSLFLWDLKAGKLRESCLNETQSVRAMVAHAPQRLLAYALAGRQLVVRDLVRPGPVCAFALRQECRCLAISADGRWLAAGMSDYRIRIYDMERKQERLTLSGHKGQVSALAFSPDGRVLLSGSWDKTVKSWDAATGQVRQSFSWPVGGVRAVAYAPDGLRAAAAGDQGRIAVWDVDE
jgi:WD40 repeat protein